MLRNPPNVSIHIDRLVIDGLPIGRQDGDVFRAALEAQIAEALQAEGVAERLATLSTTPSLRAPRVVAGVGNHPSGMGRSVAQSLTEALGL